MTDNQKVIQGARLREFRELLSIKQGEMAKKLLLQQGSYSDIERGKNAIGANILEILANSLNLNVNWLLTGNGERINEIRQDLLSITIQKPNVTLYNIDASAGGLIAAQNDKGGPLEQWAIPDLNGEHIAVNVQGNSMSPTMDHGDKIIAKECYRNDLRDGQIYIVVSTDNNVRVKRLRMANEVLMLWADNVAFDPRYERLHLHEVIKMFHVVMVCKVL